MGWRNPRQSRHVPTPILVAKPSAAICWVTSWHSWPTWSCAVCLLGSMRVRGNYRLAIQSSCPLSRVPLVRKLFCCEPAANHLQCHCGLRWGGTKGRINARAGTSLTSRFQVLGLGTFAGAFLMLDAFWVLPAENLAGPAVHQGGSLPAGESI
jgi:hypothetical protein